MKIIFIQPSDSHVDGSLKGGVWHAPPIGLTSLASYVREKGHTPKIVDLGVESKNIFTICKKFNPDYIAFSVTTPLLAGANFLAKRMKETFPEKKIIFGGPHPSTDVRGVIEQKHVDFVVIGEGEITLGELLEGKKFSEIRGLAYRQNGRIMINPPRELIKDLDSLPIPAYDLLNIFKYPNHPLSIRSPSIPLITSRGCPFECTYCNKSVFGRTFRTLNYKKVVDQMEYLIKKYNVREFQLIDDTFTLDRERVKNICMEILKRKMDIKWMTPNGIRVGSLDLETLKLMKKAGCHYLYLGIESGSPKILKRIKKGITLSQIHGTVRMINKAGIRVGAFFMMGLPDEKIADIEQTINLAKSLKLDSVKFGILVPLPGTEVFEEFKKKGYIKNFNFSDYFWHKEPVFETELISSEVLFKYYKRAYREFYLRPKYVIDKILNIKSFSDVKNILKGVIVVINNQLSKK